VTADEPEEAEGDAEFERPIDKFRKTATGSVLAAGMLGLAEALEGREKEEPAIVVDAGGEPFDPDIVMRLDPDNPGDSIVMVRKHPPETNH
jgi:hypothetical protein